MEPFSGIVAAPNALLIVGGASTVSEALAGISRSGVGRGHDAVVLHPAVVPGIFRETVQDAPGASETPERLGEPDPAVAVAVPPQVLFTLGGVATTPAGKVSVKRRRSQLGSHSCC